MVTLGSDSHKHTHTVVAVDATGRRLAERTVAATPAGHLELVRWAAQSPDRTWALEDVHEVQTDGLSVIEVARRVLAVWLAAGGGRRDSADVP